MSTSTRPALWLVLASLAIGCASVYTHDADRVLLNGTKLFPESITSTRDGTLIAGSIGEGSIFRAAPGAVTAERWIMPRTNGLLSVFGVLADEKSRTLWVCSSEATNGTILAGPGEPSSALLAFDLKSGAPVARYPFPAGEQSLCNDIAIGRDGTAYVTDTRNSRILRLRPRAAALEVWLRNEMLQGGVDGIAFGQLDMVYVNTITAGKLIRIHVRADGSAGEIQPIHTSRPLERPDGMRAVSENEFLLVEGAGRLDLVSVRQNDALVKTLRDGFMTPSGVTPVGNSAWVVEGKFPFRTDPILKNSDPGPFYASAVRWRQ